MCSLIHTRELYGGGSEPRFPLSWESLTPLAVLMLVHSVIQAGMESSCLSILSAGIMELLSSSLDYCYKGSSIALPVLILCCLGHDGTLCSCIRSWCATEARPPGLGLGASQMVIEINLFLLIREWSQVFAVILQS